MKEVHHGKESEESRQEEKEALSTSQRIVFAVL